MGNSLEPSGLSGPVDLASLPTPCFVIDLGLLRRNCSLLREVQNRSGSKILLALKGFATWKCFPYISHFLSGTSASSPHEARLGRERFGKEVHVYSPAYSDQDIEAILPLADHLCFNSLGQWERFKDRVQTAPRRIECGLRINPQFSVSTIPKYDPCSPMSRFGIRANELGDELPEGISGLHFHTLCEQNVEPLAQTLGVVEQSFGHLVEQAKWVNFGGGHHITRSDYKVAQLIKLIRDFRSRYKVDVYLEPGEGVALHCGVLISTVLDVVERDGESVAILDSSATAHMPDVLEIPYQPDILGARHANHLTVAEEDRYPYRYRLGGNTCLSCDEFGDYAFAKPLAPGERLVFANQAIYTMVKTTTFNGLGLPSIALYEPSSKTLKVVRDYGYESYEDRLS